MKTIVVGVTGGIAAYKSAYLVSQLVKAGYSVYVVMTASAQKFIAPLTLQTLSKHPVVTGMFEKTENWEVEHISLAKKADAFVICPATANVIGKIAGGIADDFLTTTVMAATCPVIFAPAMNCDMYENPIVQKNIETLSKLGYRFVEPESGMLACGVEGKGRLAEMEAILDEISCALCSEQDFLGRKVLVTAGPTREAIDPVRYITNHSSGKMGYAIAKAAKIRGAQVTLVSGPTNLRPFSGVQVINVTTALEMEQAVLSQYAACDVVVKAAAVADFRPERKAENKLKKSGVDAPKITLVQNPDILEELGRQKNGQILVGFCMETQNLLDNAKEKLHAKHLDMIVANSLTEAGAGFAGDTNAVTILFSDGRQERVECMQKLDLANLILDRVKGSHLW